MAKKGVKLGLNLAKDMRTVVSQVLGDNGRESKGGFPPTQLRQPRFYKAPSGGVAAPTNSTTPSSTACKLMKWNSGGTAFEETGVTETVYSFSAYAADEIFQGKTVAGRVFADKSGGGADPLAWASHDFTYTGSGSSDGTNNFATPANRYTSDDSVIDFSTHARILNSGYFFFHVDGIINFDFPTRHINDYGLNGIKRYMTQTGTTSLSAAGGAVASTSITFADTFDSVPGVALTITSWGNAGIPILRVSSLGTGGFTLVMTNKDGSNATGSVSIRWTATGEFDDSEDSFDQMHVMSDHFVSCHLVGDTSTTLGATDFQLNDRISTYDTAGTLEGNVHFSFSGWFEATANPYQVRFAHFNNGNPTTNWSKLNSITGSVFLLASDSSPNESEVAEAP